MTVHLPEVEQASIKLHENICVVSYVQPFLQKEGSVPRSMGLIYTVPLTLRQLFVLLSLV